jgi:hypothetical protein
MYSELEIYFDDLTEDAQERVLDFYGVEDASELGTGPLTILVNDPEFQEQFDEQPIE